MTERQCYLLVTVDPELEEGGRGDAFELVRQRLANQRWPLFRGTRHRDRFRFGDAVAFYVGGAGPLAGRVVATAVVDGVVLWQRGDPAVDPDNVLTDPPFKVLRLTEVSMLATPVRLQSVLPRLSFAPSYMQRWGVCIMGGSRRLTGADWTVLLGRDRLTASE
jgi:hypothetical protein